MKNITLAFGIAAFSFTGAFAQMQVDKAIELTGSGSNAKVTGIQEVAVNADAANKIYVDTAIANRTGDNSVFTFSMATGRSSIQFLDVSLWSDTTLIEVSKLSGDAGIVYLTASGLPSGISFDFFSGGGFVSYRSVMQLKRTGTITPGNYTVTVTGTGGGNVVSTTFNLEVVTAKIIFTTSTTTNGNIGGQSGADAICQSLATAAGLSGTYMAFLSSSTVGAASRLSHGTGPYVLRNGSKVGDNWNDLFDNSLYNAMNVDEYGNTVSYTENWTNSNGSGGVRYNTTTNTCNNWNNGTSSYNGSYGRNDEPNYNYWMDYASTVSCASLKGLFCFEQ